jgi:hypothetical protein
MSQDEKKKQELDRRSFLKRSIMGVGTGILMASPLDIFLSNILMGVFQRANALAAGNEGGFLDKKLINISMANAPSRWMFDMPLRPNGNDTFRYNSVNDPASSMLVTRLKPGAGPGGYIGEYATTKVGDYYLPYLWAGNLATPTGSAPMANLAQNMIMMRGLNLNLDSHELDRYKQMVPIGSESLTGLVADHSTTVLPAVGSNAGLNGGQYYASKRGVTYQDLGGTDPFTTAFSPFSGGASLRTIQATTSAAIDRTLDIMKNDSSGKHKYLPNSYQDRANAKKLMTMQFSGLKDTFSSLQAKYETLIKRSFGDTSLRLAGVDNLALSGSQINAFKIYLDSSRSCYYTGSDLSSITDMSTTISNLSSGLAVAEFMITGGVGGSQSFSSSMNIVLNGGFSNLLIDSAYGPASGTTAEKQYTNVRQTATVDAHEVGSYVSMLLFSRYFRAVSSCVYEFTNRLKATKAGTGTLFDQTAITITSEFNRAARDAGGGADHGWAGTCYSIVSGMVPELIVGGNISSTGQGTNANNAGYGGTWGYGSPMKEFTGQTPLIGNAATTVTTLLDLPTPTPNNPSFVSKDKSTGKVALAVSKPENV